jgi:hypothetical protein
MTTTRTSAVTPRWRSPAPPLPRGLSHVTSVGFFVPQWRQVDSSQLTSRPQLRQGPSAMVFRLMVDAIA